MQRLLLCLLMVFFSGGLAAESAGQRSTLIIDLEHRSTEEVISGLKPHLGDRVSVSGQEQRLLLRGPDEELGDLEDLVAALDQPEEEYRLLFSQGKVDLQKRQTSTSRHYSTSRNDLITLRLTAGVPARLERGFWVPVSKTKVWSQHTEYQWMAGGVWVQAHARGEEVVLAFSSRTLEKDFSGSEVESQVRLQPGRWQTLASEGQLSASGSGNSRRFSTNSSEYYYSVCIERPASDSQCPTF
ncbi:hypothetical protein [Marinospirillum sp.]|uniref:hypothetical protein n=1 Tax=Marinospirillum sp. TaxID=2183934 RepID=UPI00286FD3DF|nr:hypothetical protein [Marinospirillum sp.]MDR9468108.1 hypothetical protein [Marinospirillum sp.]